jgi:hypothetical protein
MTQIAQIAQIRGGFFYECYSGFAGGGGVPFKAS